MADITSGCTVIADNIGDNGGFVLFSTAATADDGDYIVMTNATKSNTLTGKRLLTRAAFAVRDFALAGTAANDPLNFDSTMIKIGGSTDNKERRIIAFVVPVTSTGGD